MPLNNETGKQASQRGELLMDTGCGGGNPRYDMHYGLGIS